MIEIRIPDRGALQLEHLVLDFNGTLARDGVLLKGVRERLQRLAAQLAIYVVTGDTFGRAREELAGVPCELTILSAHGQAEAKRAFVERIGPQGAVCIGNGNNDRLMLAAAALAIAVIQDEGAAVATLQAAHVAVRHVDDALDLLAHPQRLVATLRG